MTKEELVATRKRIDACWNTDGDGKLVRLVGDAARLADALEEAWRLIDEYQVENCALGEV